jgi:hypothetical protein
MAQSRLSIVPTGDLSAWINSPSDKRTAGFVLTAEKSTPGGFTDAGGAAVVVYVLCSGANPRN